MHVVWVLLCKPTCFNLDFLKEDIVPCSAASQSTSGPQTIGDTTIELKLTCVAVVDAKKLGTQIKKVPESMTIGMLKTLIGTIFSMGTGHIKLFIKDKQLPVPEPMEDDDRLQLKFLDLKVCPAQLATSGCFFATVLQR